MKTQLARLVLTGMIGVVGISATAHPAIANSLRLVTDSRASQELHDYAVEHILAGRMFEALQALNDLLRRDPSNASAYFNRGNVHYFRREFEAALNDYSLAMAHSPGFAAAAMNRGVVFSNLDRLDDAIEDLDLAAELDPANPDVFYNRAIVQVKRGLMDEALADYDRVLQREVESPDLAASRGRLRALLTRVDEAGSVGESRNQSVIKEIEHARNVELFLDFANRTCVEHGDDVGALAALAARDGWEKATDTQLSRGSTPSKQLIGGWTATNRLGTMVIILLKSLRNLNVQSCVITAKLGDAHWFDDFVTSFTSRFVSPRLVVSELEGSRTSRQVVVRRDNARVEVLLTHRTDAKTLTFHAVHAVK